MKNPSKPTQTASDGNMQSLIILTCGWCEGKGQVSDGYNGHRDCEICKGKGKLKRMGELCPNCEGQGYRMDPYSVVYPMTLPCRGCNGSGVYRGDIT